MMRARRQRHSIGAICGIATMRPGCPAACPTLGRVHSLLTRTTRSRTRRCHPSRSRRTYWPRTSARLSSPCTTVSPSWQTRSGTSDAIASTCTPSRSAVPPSTHRTACRGRSWGAPEGRNNLPASSPMSSPPFSVGCRARWAGKRTRRRRHRQVAHRRPIGGLMRGLPPSSVSNCPTWGESSTPFSST